MAKRASQTIRIFDETIGKTEPPKPKKRWEMWLEESRADKVLERLRREPWGKELAEQQRRKVDAYRCAKCGSNNCGLGIMDDGEKSYVVRFCLACLSRKWGEYERSNDRD